MLETRSQLPRVLSTLVDQKFRTALKAHDLLVEITMCQEGDELLRMLDSLAECFTQLEELADSIQEEQSHGKKAIYTT